MAESGVILPADSTGKATRTETVTTTFTTGSGGVVHMPVSVLGDPAIAANLANILALAGGVGALQVNLAGSQGAPAITTGTVSAAGNTVVASVGSQGNGTIVLYGGTYTALTLLFEASIDNTNWFPIDVVRADGSGVIPGGVGEQFAATGVRAWNFMAPGYQQVRARVGAITQTVVPTISITQGPFLYDPSPSVAPIDGNRPSYSATLNSTSVAAAVTTSVPVWEMVNPTGSGKLVRVTRLAWELTLATAGTVPLVVLQKRTAASTGGTAVTQTATQHDTLNGAPSVTNKYYTAIPTVAGSSLGNARSIRVFGPATTLTTTPTLVEWLFGNRPAQSLVLRPGESVNLQGIAAFGTAPTITGGVEWTEETAA